MSGCRPLEKEELREIMASSRLPVLPPGAPYLLQAMSSDEIDFRELAGIIEKFPPIAARLISLANSTWSSPVVAVTSLEMACARLGFFVVRSVSVALSIANIFNPGTCPPFDGIRYWSNAFLTADLSFTLADHASKLTDIDAQVARTAGLLHNLGLLWLATWKPEETGRALLLADSEPERDLDDLLEAECGIGFIEAGALLAAAWKFPPVLVTAIHCQADDGYDGEDWETAALVNAARRLIDPAPAEQASGETPDPLLERLGVTPESRTLLLEHLAGRREEIEELARTLFSS